jgi:undecaprenyl-diphosphatase
MGPDDGYAQEPAPSRWDRIGAVDWPISRALALSGDRRLPVFAAKAVSRLGDGPIYALILAALILFRPNETGAIILSAGVSILLLHVVYPPLKKKAARPRPVDVESDFAEAPAPLDRYSFPSGHIMTLTAALIPIIYVAPRIWPIAVGAWIAMAWARLAIGHHYASDIAAGTLMGAGVSGLLTYWLVA